MNIFKNKRWQETIMKFTFSDSSSIRQVKNKALLRPRNVQSNNIEVVKWGLLVIPVGAFGLGCWQVHRLQWKLGLLELLQRKSNALPVSLPHSFAELKYLEYSPVKIKGRFLHEREFLIGPRALIENESAHRPGSLMSDPNKNQGFLVVTPFQLSDTGDVILVNRGWIPKKLKSKESRKNSMIDKEVELVGVVRLSEQRAPFVPKNIPEKGQWHYRDLDEMSSYARTSPVWLDVKGIPEPPDGWPVPNQTRVTLRNEHFSYLVTWFSLSAFTSIMWYRHFVKRLPLI